jgi:hypothetical protein
MHIFKNVPDSIFRHISGKEKDTLSLRRDIALLRTRIDRRHLWPNRENEKYAEAPWILKKKKELDQAFNIDRHITIFKTHNFHNFMKVLYIII